MQGLNDVRLANDADVDLTIIGTQLEIVTVDQDNSWAANSLPLRMQIFITCSPQSMRCKSGQFWIHMYKQNTAEENVAQQSFCDK